MSAVGTAYLPRWFRVFDGLVLSHDCDRCFSSYGVLSSACIPDCVHGLCDGCFFKCKSLRRVAFGSSSSLEKIGVSCFECTGVECSREHARECSLAV